MYFCSLLFCCCSQPRDSELNCLESVKVLLPVYKSIIRVFLSLIYLEYINSEPSCLQYKLPKIEGNEKRHGHRLQDTTVLTIWVEVPANVLLQLVVFHLDEPVVCFSGNCCFHPSPLWSIKRCRFSCGLHIKLPTPKSCKTTSTGWIAKWNILAMIYNLLCSLK